MKDIFRVLFNFSGAETLEEFRATSIFPVVAFDDESNVFLLDDRNLGFAFECYPLVGANENLHRMSSTILNLGYPANSYLNFFWYKSPDIEDFIAEAEAIRQDYTENEVVTEVFNERKKYIESFVEDRAIPFADGVVHTQRLLITVKIPYTGEEFTEKDLQTVAEIRSKLEGALKATSLHPLTVNADRYIKFMQTIFNWGPEASWKNTPNSFYDGVSPISEQILDYSTDIEITKNSTSTLRVGEKYLKIYSAKRLPDAMFFGDGVGYVGDLMGSNTQSISKNYFVSVGVMFPDYQDSKSFIESRRQQIVYQAHGPLLKFVPTLADKYEGFNELYRSLNDGHIPCKVSFSVGVFSDTEEEARKSGEQTVAFFSSRRFSLIAESLLPIIILKESLPFGANWENVKHLWRHKTMTTEQAVVLLPLFSEWKGTGTPHVSLFSRNGQIMSLSLHDTGTNKNGIIVAPSGSGKSFLANELIFSYLSEGAKVWTIDVGRSYEKLCEMVNGQFITFDSKSEICLNPFDICDNYEEEDHGVLLGILQTMISPSSKLSDYQLTKLSEVLNEAWYEKGKSTTIDDIAQKLLNFKTDESDDQMGYRVRDLGHQLYPFTSSGPYGKYFVGRNNVQMDNQFVVLELEELKGKPALQQVVLLQLINQIQHEVYLGERDKKKILMIDESWDLLKDEKIAYFMEHAYRRFRKYGGSAVIITQLLNDLFSSASGRTIASNSATKFILRPEPSDLASAKKSGDLGLSETAFDYLASLSTVKGEYSEIYIIGDGRQGIARLFVSRFQQLLYSTDPRDVYEIKQLTSAGYTVIEAIKEIIKKRGLN